MSEQNQENLNRRFYKKGSFWFVFLYLLFIAIYTIIFICKENKNIVLLTSNELGDFLAGSFAPLAFLFLYLGYKQQGEELRQNTEALERQATELANSVAEQKRLIQLHKDELVSKHFSAQPFLEVFPESLRLYSEPYDITDENDNVTEVIEREFCEFNFVIENKGECAKLVSIVNEQSNYIFLEIHEINKNEKHSKKVSLSDHEVELLKSNKYFSKKYNIKFHDVYGKQYLKSIKIDIQFYEPENQYYLAREIISSAALSP